MKVLNIRFETKYESPRIFKIIETVIILIQAECLRRPKVTSH